MTHDDEFAHGALLHTGHARDALRSLEIPDEEHQATLHEARQLAPLALAHVTYAARVIDASGAVEAIETWEATDRKYRGGRRPYLSIRATLILWVVLAMEEQPLFTKLVGEMLSKRMTPKVAAALGVPFEPLTSMDQMHERARRGIQRILRLIDDKPVPDRRIAYSVERWADIQAERGLIDDVLTAKRHRAFRLQNMLLHATYLMLPDRFRTERVSLAVDATAIGYFARGRSKTRLENPRPGDTVSVEADCAWYVRKKDDRDTGKAGNGRATYGMEAEFAVLASNDPDQPDAVPHIVMGIAHHQPAVDPTGAAMRVFENIVERGLHLEYISGDRLYFPGAKAKKLQDPLRALGGKLVMSYHKKYLGKRFSKHGAIFVEGKFYSPGMPTPLINATKTYQRNLANIAARQLAPEKRKLAEKAAWQRWQTRLDQRRQYQLREKELPDARGKVPMMCPAAGPNPTMTCVLKPSSIKPNPKRPLLPVTNQPKMPGAICTNKTSVSFDLTDQGKFGQHFPYGTPEWYTAYTHGRQSVESFNAFIKDGGSLAIAMPSRRRLRGTTAQSLLLTIAVVAANLKKIGDFLRAKAEQKLNDADLADTSNDSAPEAKTRRARRSKSTSMMRLANRGAHSRQHEPLLT